MAGILAGKRVLVVEDEYFIASDLKRALLEAEASVLGPVGNLDQGLALADGEALDAAVLDVNLEGAKTFLIADRLSDRAVPFMFLTGNDGWALPDAYRLIPRVTKPFRMNAVMDCVGQMLATEMAS